jgi:DNA-nicking Smr family endonuclease
MSGRRQLSDDERTLWTGVVRSITPLRRSGKIARSEESAKPVGEKKHEKKHASTPSRPPDTVAPPKPQPKIAALAPLGRRLRQRVARGRDPIDDRIDLHGYTQQRAYMALLHFLQRAQADGARIVLVVTGKGGSRSERDPSGERGVLKRQVPMWLSLPEFRSMIVGFDHAHVGHGGEGALYVRLRRSA